MSNTNENLLPAIVLSFIAGMVFVVAVLFLSAATPRQIHREAVQRGYAEYVVDLDGNVTFKWK